MGTGTPRINTIVRPKTRRVAGPPIPVEHAVVLEVSSVELSVETALNPGTCVVVVVTVVHEVTVIVG